MKVVLYLGLIFTCSSYTLYIGDDNQEAVDGAPLQPVKSVPSLRASNKAIDSEAQAVLQAPISLKASMGPEDFNKAISDLMRIGSLGLTKEEFDATPFGGSVKKLKDLIEKDLMPKVKEAHEANQKQLEELATEVTKCHTTKDEQVLSAQPEDDSYKKFSPSHITCRTTEDGLFKDKVACWEDEADKKKVRDLRCNEFKLIDEKFTDQNENMIVVTKGGSEASDSYLTRVSATVCGEPYTTGQGGHGKGGFLDEWKLAQEACLGATADHHNQKTSCEADDITHLNEQQKCDNIQDQMDASSCKYAVDIKDACEEYAECYQAAWEAYETTQKAIHQEAEDRQEEWKDLSRMLCVVETFADGKVEQTEITMCKEQTHDISDLEIDWPEVLNKDECEVPKEYPTTSDYKKVQFEVLPQNAKGKEDSNECAGVAEISTTPAAGSPDSCQCERVTLNGPYSPGPLVKCVNCLDVRRTNDKISCPEGTKLFAPRSRADWKTFFASANALEAPSWIIDITSAKNGCGGCAANAMNSLDTQQNQWVTQDATAWFLRSKAYPEGPGDTYQESCYMSLFQPSQQPPEDHVSFKAEGCNYHAKSYYCQHEEISTTPKEGSPPGCLCEKVELSSSYKPGQLVRCTGCLDVKMASQKNSCPMGTKLFAPETRGDWKTIIASVSPETVKKPNWIIDVTRPQNGCGGCASSAMNSGIPAQATWVTTDGNPWYLRGDRFEFSENYEANCYMEVSEATTENSVKFAADQCNFHSDSYYCQKAKKA